jgi:hypothetical protein
LDAAFAAFADVVLVCDLLCVRALPAADFTVLLDEVLNAFEAFFAVLLPVVFAIVDILIYGALIVF